MADGPARPFRITHQKFSWDTRGRWIWSYIFTRFLTWGFRRLKPMFYHPIGMAGTLVVIGSYLLSAWLTLTLVLAVYAWALVWPDSYLRHVQLRISSFLAGFKYRHRPRPKLKANGLINDRDPIPTISHVRKTGCTTRVRIKMSYGDEIDYWRERSSRLAQTYNAADCRINPYKRDNFLTLRPNKLDKPPYVQFKAKEQTTKYRWLEIDFLTKDPFMVPVGVEYIDLHRTKLVKAKNDQDEEIDIYLPQEGDPVGPKRDGSPYLLEVQTHLLNISITGGGKTNAERTMIYAGYQAVVDETRENWGCDLARGVELRPIKHCFARIEDGRDGPQAVLQFWTDVRNVLWRRLDAMEAAGQTLFVPYPGNPKLDVYFDEMGILETVPYADYRKAIYATMSEVLVQGRKAKISIRAFSQNPKLERLPLRDDFPEVHLGKVKTRSQIRMAMDDDAYERGAKAVEIDRPGVYYVETESGVTPEHFRFVETTLADMGRLLNHPESVLWPRSVEEERASVREEVMIA